MIRWVSRSAALAAGAAALFSTGCVRSRPEPGLLGARTLVPAPFVEPAASGPATTALPAEPTFPGTAIVPATIPQDDNLVMQPVDSLEDTKPVKSSPGRSAAPARADYDRQTYSVKKGDSLWLIARRYGVTVAELTAENSIPESKVLKIGQTLTLPRGARLRDVSEVRHTPAPRRTATAASKPHGTSSSKPAPSATKSAGSSTSSGSRKAGKEPIPADGMYTIKSGDNPWDLSRKFGVKHDELMQWNNLKSDTVLQVGQKIRLRGGASESSAAAPAATAAKPATAVLAPVPAPAPTPAPAPGAVLTEAPLAPLAPLTPLTPAAPVGAEIPTPTAPVGAAPAPAAGAGTGAAGGAAVATGAPAPTLPAGALDLPKKLSHTVTDGETLQIIAEMYGTTVDAIKKENPTVKTDADLLPNLKLMVPYR
jgi:LysM repeat protein